jgi:cellobiose-specific phosphotransferase system component IIC
MFRFIFQFGAASAVFLFSSLVAWYEGSALLDHPSEWRTSTPITQLVHGTVHVSSQISQWDFFVYAAKYEPTFPMIMTVSGLYFLIFLGYYIFKKVRKWYAYYLFSISSFLFLLGYFCYESTTEGAQKMFVLFSGCGLFCMLIGFINYLLATIRMKRRQQIEVREF